MWDDFAIFGQEDSVVVLVIDWVYLKETLPTSWLKAINLCDTELSYELEAD